MAPTNIVALFLCTVLFFALYSIAKALRRIHALLTSPLRDLRGPPSLSWVTGSVKGVYEADAPEAFASWVKEYGPTFKYHSFGNINKMITVDLKAINHILAHTMEFYRSDRARFILHKLTGDGILAMEGTRHRLQRKILNPAFGTQQIRSFMNIFVDKSVQLRDVLTAKFAAEAPRKDGAIQVDMFDWLGKLSLDIIGLAGFDYAFDSMTAPEDQPNELYKAVHTISSGMYSVIFILSIIFPPARLIPTKRSRELARAHTVIRRISARIVEEKKAALIASSIGDSSKAVEKNSIEGRDLLSQLIKANMAVDIPDDARLNDEELVSQIPTFIIAGHETLSTSMSWTLLLLSCNKKAQDKLRAELRAYPRDVPSMEELDSFPYLDAVLREGLRLHSPIPATERVPLEDCVIPVDNEYLDRHGNLRREIRLNKGDNIFIPLRELHTMKEIWGDDAAEFNPDRWDNLPETAKALPGVFHPILSFTAGPHSCIGYRFSVIEAKAILFTLIRAFEFDMAVPEEKIIRKTLIVGRPHVIDDLQKGPQLPLLIRPVKLD
ncbi:cytochrome P450 [Dentipellis sp. KUC8613]|nr:cytochrome P450 [Dentipellis sp. KUC8613]